MLKHSPTRRGSARLAVGVVVTSLALGVVSTQVEAAGHGKAISPVGKYISAVIPVRSGTIFYGPLTLKASGAFVFKGGPKGTWTDTNGAVIMTGQLMAVPFVFTVKQVGRNLGTPSRKGSATEGGHPFANWYAARL
jgi:hypothetical protein